MCHLDTTTPHRINKSLRIIEPSKKYWTPWTYFKVIICKIDLFLSVPPRCLIHMYLFLFFFRKFQYDTINLVVSFNLYRLNHKRTEINWLYLFSMFYENQPSSTIYSSTLICQFCSIFEIHMSAFFKLPLTTCCQHLFVND